MQPRAQKALHVLWMVYECERCSVDAARAAWGAEWLCPACSSLYMVHIYSRLRLLLAELERVFLRQPVMTYGSVDGAARTGVACLQRRSRRVLGAFHE